ncbi:centromere protein C isoform X2 [Lissotriton helveticus]
MNTRQDTCKLKVDADLSTVDPQPLTCSTPISTNSRTAALNQNNQELVASTGVAGFVKIPIRGSLGKSSDRRIQATCRPESDQAFNTLLKHAVVSGSPGQGAKKGENLLERERPMMFESDDEEDVEAEKGEAILLGADAQITAAPLDPHDVERPHDQLYACDSSVVVEPSSPTVKLQARKRLSFKDKETPFGRKTPASKLTKLSQPEDKIIQTPRFIKIPVPSEFSEKTVPSVHTASQKDTRLRNPLQINESQHTLRKQTTDKVEILESTQALTDSQKTIRASEKQHGNSSPPLNEKSMNRFASMLFKTVHPENKLSKNTLHSSLPRPVTTEYDMEEEFEIDEVSSYFFKSWDREFKNAKPSTKQPTGAAERQKCANLEQNDTEVLDLRTVDAPPNNSPEYSSRKKTAIETKKVQALANAKDISSLPQQNKKNIAKVTKRQARQTVVRPCVTYDNHSSTVIATDAQPSHKTVSMEANIPMEVEECSSSPVSKNQALLKRKTDESQVKSKISSTLPKKTKKAFKVGALEKAVINMQNASCTKERLSLGQTHTNENFSTCIPLPTNVLAEPVPEKRQENIPQELVNQVGGQMLGSNILSKNKSVNSMSETDKNQVPPVKNAAELELTRNLPLKDRGKIKEKQLSKNQAAGGAEKEVLDANYLPLPSSDDRESNPDREPYLSENEVNPPSSVSKQRRRVKPASTFAAAHPEQDSLTSEAKGKKKVSRKQNRHVSTKKQLSKKKTTDGSEKGILEKNQLTLPRGDNRKKAPVLHQYPSQNEVKPPSSVSKRELKVKSASPLAAANPEHDLLISSVKAQTRASGKRNQHLSAKKEVNKNQASGGPEKGDLETNHVNSPLQDYSEKSSVPKSYPSQNEEEASPSVSKRGRVLKPTAAWWVVNPEQDLICPSQTKKAVSRKLSERFSKKIEVNKNQAACGQEQGDLESKHMSSPLQDHSEKSPVPGSYLSQNDEEAPVSVSKRGRVQKPAAAWWVVNPEQALLCPSQTKKTVSRKLSERFSRRATSNKKIKDVKRSKKKSLQWGKINNISNIDLPADVDGKLRLVETNTANEKTNEQLGSLSENTERRYDSESQGKKRKIDEVAENNEAKQKPVKIKKSILKVSSKYKCPLSEERTERHLEEEPENPKTEEGFALPPKMVSRVCALRKSLLPSKQTQRLSSFKGSLESFGAAYKTPVTNKRSTPEFDPKSVTPRLSPTKSLRQRDITPGFTGKVIRSKSKMHVCNYSEGNSVSENKDDGQLKSMDQIENMDVGLDVPEASQENLKHNTREKRRKSSSLKENSSEDAENLKEDPKLYTHGKKVKKINHRRDCLSIGPVLEQDRGPCKHDKPRMGSLENECFIEVAGGLQQKEDDKKAKVSCQKERIQKSVNVLQDDLEFNKHVKNIKRSYCKEVPEHIEHSKPNSNNLNHMNSSSRSECNEEESTLRNNTQSNSDYSEDDSSSGKEDSIETEQLGHVSGQCNRRSEKKKLGTVDNNIHAVTPRKEYYNRLSDTSKEKTVLNIANEMAQPACPVTGPTTSECESEEELLTPSPPAFGCSHCIQSGSGRVPSRSVRMISHKDKPVRFDLCQTDLNSSDSDADSNCTYVIQPTADKEQKIVLPSHTPNVRRSKRTRVQPLDFWRGERVVYKLRPSGGFVVDGVLSPEYKENVHRRVKAKTKRPEKREMEGYVLIAADNSPTKTQPTAVMDLVKGHEIYLDCVRRQDQCLFFSAEGLPAVCKTFIQPMFSTGEMILAPLQEKGISFVHLGTLVFYIINGEIMATVHNSQYQLKTGDYFFVPPGNVYNIQNLREESDSNILFVHIKEPKQTEVEDNG